MGFECERCGRRIIEFGKVLEHVIETSHQIFVFNQYGMKETFQITVAQNR